jgi:N-acetylneuraminic acid mutarotase
VYVLGGFDGTNLVADVLATTDGSAFTPVTKLLVPVRYPAVAVVGTALYIFGGVSTLQGMDTAVVQRFDPGRRVVEQVATLPTTLSHASAIVLGGQVYLLGGYVNSTQLSDQILRFDPTTLTSTVVGHLPAPLSDGGAAVIDNRGYLVGGQGTSRVPVSAVEIITAG